MVISMNTSSLLEILTRNRLNHIREYEEQLEGWKIAMDEFSKKLEDWKNGVALNGIKGIKEYPRPEEPRRPDSYLDSYDNAISMMRNHVEDTIQLDESDFDMYVEDNFGWKRQFFANSAVYSNRG